MYRLSVIRWQQTQGQYVAVLQDVQRFKAETLRPHKTIQRATVVVGELAGTFEKDWYCVTFPKEDMEFDEARERAIAVIEEENQRRAAGKPSLVS